MKFKKVLRVLVLVMLITLAMSGLGMITPRDPYRDKEIRTEQIDRKNEEDEEEPEEEKE
jgi:hypothetical protein